MDIRAHLTADQKLKRDDGAGAIIHNYSCQTSRDTVGRLRLSMRHPSIDAQGLAL